MGPKFNLKNNNMKNAYFFPNSYRRIGQILAILSAFLCGYYLFFAGGDLMPCRMIEIGRASCRERV